MYTCVHIYNLHIYIHTFSYACNRKSLSCSCSWFSDDSPIPAAHLESSGCSHVPANSCQLNTPQMWRWILNLNWGGISFFGGNSFLRQANNSFLKKINLVCVQGNGQFWEREASNILIWLISASYRYWTKSLARAGSFVLHVPPHLETRRVRKKWRTWPTASKVRQQPHQTFTTLPLFHLDPLPSLHGGRKWCLSGSIPMISRFAILIPVRWQGAILVRIAHVEDLPHRMDHLSMAKLENPQKTWEFSHGKAMALGP